MAPQLLICMSAYIGQLPCFSTFLPRAASTWPSLRSSFPDPGRCYPACDTSPVPSAPSWWVQLGGVAQQHTAGWKTVVAFHGSSSWEVVVGRADLSSALAQGHLQEKFSVKTKP